MTTAARVVRPGRRRPAWRLTPRQRRVVLALHVVCAAGWLALYPAMLVLGITAATTSDPELARAAYLALGRLGLTLIAPFSLAALFTGLTISSGTKWGVLRHKWVVTKLCIVLIITLYDNLVLDPKLQDDARRVSHARPGVLPAALAGGHPAVVAGIIGTTLISTATVLAIFKPWGRTKRGRKALSPDGYASAARS